MPFKKCESKPTPLIHAASSGYGRAETVFECGALPHIRDIETPGGPA